MILPRPFLTTAIGSFPFAEPDPALDLIFKALPEAPVWPQLPRRGLLEKMEVQYAEGLPRLVVDQTKGRMYFDTSGDHSAEFTAFYELCLAVSEGDEAGVDLSPMAIGPDHSRGIYALEARLKACGNKLPHVKVHTTGPCTFALVTVDENKRAIYYNEEFRDVVVKAMALKSRWQIRKFAPYAEKIICFIDEPVLSAFGSSTYLGVQRGDVVAMIAEVSEAIRAESALAGVHCCGNTDWGILIEAGVDIINFDAYAYGETVALYPEAVRQHVRRGGALAFGMVPTSAAIHGESVDSLAERYERLVDHLAARTGLDRQALLQATVLTPSCGTGSLDAPEATRVFDLLPQLSERLRSEHC